MYDNMKLYSGPLSMFGTKAELALREKGLAFDLEFVPFSLERLYDPKHPEVLRINPKAQVPVLVNGALEIFDSTQIFEYLEDLVSHPALWPTDPKGRAEARLWEFQSDEVFFPNVVQLFPHNRVRDGEEATDRALAAVGAFCAKIDEQLHGREYIAGPLSYADFACFLAQYWASFVGAPPSNGYARLQAWRARVAARESVRPVIDGIQGYLKDRDVPPPMI